MILLVLRHGKAEKDSPTGRDVDRPLMKRGERQAEYIREKLADGDGVARPEVILSSRAMRARATAEIVAKGLGREVEFEEALTLGTPFSEAMELVRRLAGAGRAVLIVGHNPQFEDLVTALTGEEQEMRTGEMVALDVRAEGKHLAAREIGRERLGEDD